MYFAVLLLCHLNPNKGKAAEHERQYEQKHRPGTTDTTAQEKIRDRRKYQLL